jgi:hypothetical protein
MLLCGHDQPPIALKQRETTQASAVSASDLERALIRRLFPEKDNTESVYLPPRWDAHFLKCKTPYYGTILGFAEDLHHPDYDEHITLNLIGYQAADRTSESVASSSCSCETPHSEWKRTPLSHSPPNTNNASTDDDSRSVAWIDFRSDPDAIAKITKRKASVFHFLRSLLTSTHDISPWQNNNNTNSMQSHDMVVLVLAEPSPILKDFRVSDAAPSWNLQAHAACQALEDWDFWNPTVSQQAAPGALYIFKRLPPRSKLSNQHPESPSLTTTSGCLWETVEIKPDEEDGEQDKETEETTIEHRLVCPPYVNLEEDYSKVVLETLFDPKHVEIFRQEALQIPHWTPWPETQHYSVSSSAHADNPEKPWTVFPLCYCFPSNQPQNRTWVESTQGFCPGTCKILKSLKTDELVVRTALFSQLAPETTLEGHTGWADLANHVLRLHIPLVVPDGDLCGTWVDGCVETHHEGRPLLFDDSKIHRAFNYHPTQSRMVLIVDLARPECLPKGFATGGHSEELDGFIQQMSAPK